MKELKEINKLLLESTIHHRKINFKQNIPQTLKIKIIIT